MESLKELYRIGPGPSSSHTLAIERACKYYMNQYPEETEVTAKLYGSLSLTGKGHMTDKIIQKAFTKKGKKAEVIFTDDFTKKHPNTMELCGEKHSMTIYSIGGGAFSIEGVPYIVDPNVYPQSTMEEIVSYMEKHDLTFPQYVEQMEPGIFTFLEKILDTMLKTADDGLKAEGMLPGPLQMKRIAKELYERMQMTTDPVEQRILEVTSYAYSCSEENASGHTVVTAPTLGSCGVLPAIMKYYDMHHLATRRQLTESLAVAGLFGNVIKTNATLSGAEGGCQAEIGTACTMAAAACSYLEGLSVSQICYAAEIGMEHHLGLTCDPVGGFVMIPCIERNGVAALRSLDAMIYAKHIGSIKKNKISFDMVVKTMNYTGKKLPLELKETSLGGLALVLPVDKENI